MAAAEETRPLVGAEPWPLGYHEPGKESKEEAARARKAAILARRAARSQQTPHFHNRIQAGEVFYTTFDLGAAAAAAKARAAAAACVYHTIDDGLDEEVRRAEAEIVSTRPAPPPRSHGRAIGWLPLSSTFPRPEPGPIPAVEPLDDLQLHRLREERRRAKDPGYFKLLAQNRRLVLDCLRHYNSMHLGDEFEPAPGHLAQHCRMYDGVCWAHGNFVARRKRSGCFSFLPAPRTLFFYEVTYETGFHGVVTCIPLLDEPVTEAYSVLGFPLWWSSRRSGRLDCICKTCYRRMEVVRPDLGRTFACGHKEVERICNACYCRSDVLHPSPGEFAFGYRMTVANEHWVA